MDRSSANLRFRIYECRLAMAMRHLAAACVLHTVCMAWLGDAVLSSACLKERLPLLGIPSPFLANVSATAVPLRQANGTGAMATG